LINDRGIEIIVPQGLKPAIFFGFFGATEQLAEKVREMRKFIGNEDSRG
jgi:hypothetical protein